MRPFYLFIGVIVLFAFSEKQTDNVLICLSPTSYAYHNSHCRGLEKCTHKIIEVTQEVALKKYGKNKACGYCY